MEETQEIERMFTLPETCEILRLERQTVIRRVNEGKLVAIRPGRKYIFPESELRRFIRENRIGGAK